MIIGGGIHGASLLYHLAKEGWTDILLVEKAELTSGSTWHAAGQITRSVGDYTTAAFHHYAIETYETLGEETGQGLSFHQPGGLRVAYNEAELDALKAQLGIGRYIGYPIELVSPSEAAELNPVYDFTDCLGAIWTEGEGHVDPTGATMAFVGGARALGAQISRRNRVVEINSRADGHWDVVTEKGTVTAEHVVDCAGCYGDQVSQMAGARTAQANVLHHYIVTETVPEFEAADREMPVMRDNRVAGYLRQEQLSGLIGIYEHRGAEACWPEGVPWEAENPLFPEDYDKIAPWLEEAFRRIPCMADLGIKSVIHGAITHTTDAHMLLGPAPGLRNFWINTGSSIGLAWGPGAGRELARWMVHGETELSLRHYDPRRFGWITPDYVVAKSIEDYEWMFKAPIPGEERFAHRPVRTSGVYERMIEKRGIHGQAYGWEQPKWFVPEDQPLEDQFSHRRAGWWEAVRAECDAVRNDVGVMDLTAFARYEVSGADGRAFLDRLTTNRVPTKSGKMTLTYALTPTGRVETEFTITLLEPDADGNERFYLISGPMGEQRDFDWLNQNVGIGLDGEAIEEDVTVVDRTIEIGTLVIAGPKARTLLSRVTDDDVSHEGFPWLSGRDITVAGKVVRALRVGFTGSLGWELHCQMADMLAVYDALFEAGADLGLVDFGSHALNSLRMEKAYLTRHELTHDIGPLQAGVSFFLRDDKDYVGKAAAQAPATGNDWRLVYLEVDAPGGDTIDGVDCHGGEGVFLNGEAVGLTTSGGFGFSVNKSLAFAYIDAASAEAAQGGAALEVLLLDEMCTARVLDNPVYDPKNDDLRSAEV